MGTQGMSVLMTTRRVLEATVQGSNILGVLLIWAIMGLMCSDVISRNLFNKPIAGVSDMVASAVVAIVFLQLASAIRNRRLTSADLLAGPLNARFPFLGLLLRSLFCVLGCVICLGIAWYSLPRLSNSWTRSEFVGIVGVMTFPRWPILAVTVYGAVLAGIQFLANIARDVAAFRDGQTGGVR